MAQLGRRLNKIATHVDLRTLRKHVREPKVPKKGSYAADAWHEHVLTARVIKAACAI
ncbi:unnamed protein product [Mycetohabitans rhizoxinica HKI 454]|uniref:Uncharacterized protein n=1 Tax=Mycetohabitans rhizoxinica (strain DSM 19002 / CIP 109453 / HKI 454) TaxID=882378 RepID=E5ARS2_MYCRK|nr:unnamed protein product [Mycetohabitans rhizoxinica HKI 454]